MLEDFEIFFSDLTIEAQKRFLDFMELKSADEGNYDVIPITIVPVPLPLSVGDVRRNGIVVEGELCEQINE